MSLYDKLIEYSKQDTVPMHMPGHKRQIRDSALPYSIDITEIKSFDNLHDRHGILKELSEALAHARGAAFAFPVVNGSTAGILASVYAMTKPGDGVIISRGCHKSVYRACEIRNLRVSYLYPETSPEGFFLSVDTEELKNLLSRSPGTKLVIITSPTYEGIISDIRALSETAHSFGAKLLVDAAHGAHLGYSEHFPPDVVSLGADVSVESLHKTLPALTQTSALYLGRDTDPEPFEDALDIFETSSPSYPLMASIDRCLGYIEDKSVFTRYSALLDEFYSSAGGLEKIAVLDFSGCKNVFDSDRGKIVISTLRCNKNAGEIAELLRDKYRIEPEMAGAEHIICMTSVCDTRDNLFRLSGALREIDKELSEAGSKPVMPAFPRAKIKMMLSEAVNAGSVSLPLSEAAGKISAQYLWAYPPGIPVLAPGEEITAEILQYIKSLELQGVCMNTDGFVRAVKNK